MTFGILATPVLCAALHFGLSSFVPSWSQSTFSSSKSSGASSQSLVPSLSWFMSPVIQAIITWQVDAWAIIIAIRLAYCVYDQQTPQSAACVLLTMGNERSFVSSKGTARSLGKTSLNVCSFWQAKCTVCKIYVFERKWLSNFTFNVPTIEYYAFHLKRILSEIVWHCRVPWNILASVLNFKLFKSHMKQD